MKFLSTVIVLLFAAVAGAQDSERDKRKGMTQPGAHRDLGTWAKRLFVAGQVALDGDGNVIGKGDMPAQVRQVLENLKTVLASAGADFSNVVKVNIFTTDIDRFLETSAVRREYLGDHPPTSTLVQIERLARPVFLVEIEAIAIAPE